MSDLKVVNAILDRICEDEQFDPWSPGYLGYINVCPIEDWTVEELDAFSRLIKIEPAVMADALSHRRLEMQTFSEGEAIFATLMPYNRLDYQGRSAEQVSYSERAVMGSLTVMVVIVTAFLAYTLSNI